MSKSAEIAQFVETVAHQMGLELTAQAEEMEDGLRIYLEGEHGHPMMMVSRLPEVQPICPQPDAAAGLGTELAVPDHPR